MQTSMDVLIDCRCLPPELLLKARDRFLVPMHLFQRWGGRNSVCVGGGGGRAGEVGGEWRGRRAQDERLCLGSRNRSSAVCYSQRGNISTR